jgi:PIN domain nuclease of toxin-antitoxin system
MRVLLDTCTFLWLQLDQSRIPRRLLQALALPETRRFLSASAAWEIAIKWSNGKLSLPLPPDEFIKRATTESLLESVPIFESSALLTVKLPLFHKDPFDRILVAQAIEHSLIIATSDPLIKQYAVRTIWD